MPEYGQYSKEWKQQNPGWNGAQQPQGGTPAGPQPIDFSSYAQDDPRMVEAYDILKGRMSSDNSKRAIDKAVLGTMDAAALGAKDLGANMARRGISGTGTGASFLQKNVYAPAQREAAGKAAEISLAEQDRQDRLAAALQGPAGGIAGMNLNNRQFGLSSWQAQQQNAVQRAQLEQQARDNELARWMALTQMDFGSVPGGMPQPPTGGTPYGSQPYGSTSGAGMGGGGAYGNWK